MRPKVNQLKVGVILSYISKAITVVVGLLYTPVMIRLLGQNEFGLYNLAASTIAYLGILNFGFSSAYIRFYSRYKVVNDQEKIAVLNSMFLSVFSVLGVIAVIAGIVIALNVDLIFGTTLSLQELQMTRLLILILVVNLSVSFPAIVFNTYIQANEKFIFQNILQIILQITTPLINIPILFMGFGSVGMVLGTVTVNVLVEIYVIYYCIKKLKMTFQFKDFDRHLMVEMTVFSSYIFINMVVDQINNNVDKTILGRYQGTISVAIYSIGANLLGYFQQISITVSNVFIPRIHRMVAENTKDAELTELFTRVGRVQFILLSLVLSGFIFFGRPFIGIWAGADYYNSFPVALLLMIAAFVPLIQNIGIEIQRAKNMHQFRSVIYLLIAVVNIILSIPLAQRFGEVGAALGTAISIIVGNGVIMNWYYHEKVGLNIRYFWQEIFKFVPALILPITYGMIINQFVDLYRLDNFLMYGLLYVILYVGAFWIVGLNEYEKYLVKNPLS